jgi:hypothetical protein
MRNPYKLAVIAGLAMASLTAASSLACARGMGGGSFNGGHAVVNTLTVPPSPPSPPRQPPQQGTHAGPNGGHPFGSGHPKGFCQVNPFACRGAVVLGH